MYLRLAKLAAERQDYDEALQLLTRAQSIDRVHPIQDLDIILLVSGSSVCLGIC